MDFQEFKNDGLMDKGSLSGANPEAYLGKNRLLAPPLQMTSKLWLPMDT